MLLNLEEQNALDYQQKIPTIVSKQQLLNWSLSAASNFEKLQSILYKLRNYNDGFLYGSNKKFSETINNHFRLVITFLIISEQ